MGGLIMKKKFRLNEIAVKSLVTTAKVQGGHHTCYHGTVYNVTECYELCITYQAPCPTDQTCTEGPMCVVTE